MLNLFSSSSSVSCQFLVLESPLFQVIFMKNYVKNSLFEGLKGVEKKMSPFEIHTLTQSIFNLQISFKYQWNCLENTVSMMSMNYSYGD